MHHNKNKYDNGARIKYDLLQQIVLEDLNRMIRLSEEEKNKLVEEAIRISGNGESKVTREKMILQIEERLASVDGAVMKIYEDMYTGLLEEDRARNMIEKFKAESSDLTLQLTNLKESGKTEEVEEKPFERFFALTEKSTEIKEISPEILQTFIDKIVIEPKVYPPGKKATARGKDPYTQRIYIRYKFIEVLPVNE